jgi:hypothetical protein
MSGGQARSCARYVKSYVRHVGSSDSLLGPSQVSLCVRHVTACELFRDDQRQPRDLPVN